MSTQDASPENAPEETPVTKLPYYESLRLVLEPYTPAVDVRDAEQFVSSAELIASIEQHHGVVQGTQQGMAENWIRPYDFVRAMRYLGYREKNTGGIQLQWLLKKKP